MSLMTFLMLVVIAGICGAVAQALAGYSRGGCFLSILLGFVGAWVGRWIAAKFQLPVLFSLTVGGVDFPIVWATVGAIVVLTVVNLFTGSRL